MEQPQGPAAITLPSERPEVKEIQIAPQFQEEPKPLFNEKPKVEASGSDKMKQNDAIARADIDKSDDQHLQRAPSRRRSPCRASRRSEAPPALARAQARAMRM